MKKHRLLWVLALAMTVLMTWFMGAYAFAPRAWRFVERRHPALQTVGARAVTASGIPADIVNIAFVGGQDDLLSTLNKAGWSPADPLTLKSSLRIAVDAVARRSYVSAPVSPLYMFGRVQDFAFERQDGGDPCRRHHVRFWKAPITDSLGRPLWLGAATYDFSVGLARTTGQITHHTAAHVDRERDRLLSDVERTSPWSVTWVEGYQPALQGTNGGGDRYETDGRLAVLGALP